LPSCDVRVAKFARVHEQSSSILNGETGLTVHNYRGSRALASSLFMGPTSIDVPSSELSKVPQALNVRDSESGKLVTLRLNASTLAIGISATLLHMLHVRQLI